MPQLILDKNLCMKSKKCVLICPTVFELDYNGRAQIKPGADTTAPCVATAINECPAGAIWWE